MTARLFCAFAFSIGLFGCSGADIGIECTNGTTCPPDLVCDDEGMCVDPDGECGGVDDGVACTGGECANGTCVAYFCGDDKVTEGETCEGAAGPGDCIELGYDRGTPTCADECTAPGVTRCARLRFTLLQPPVGSTSFAAVFATETEIWIGTATYGLHFDGDGWFENDARANLLHGSGRDNIWALRGLDARHFDGSEWSEMTLDGVATALHVTADEALIGADGANGLGIYRFDATSGQWQIEHASGIRYTAIGSVGTAIVATHRDGISIRTGSSWTEVASSTVLNVTSLHGGSLSDVYLAGSGGTFHYNGDTISQLDSIRSRVMALGDSIVHIGFDSTSRVHKPTEPLTTAITLASPGTPPIPGTMFQGQPIRAAYSTGSRVVAATNGAAFTFYGTGNAPVTLPHDAARQVSLTDGNLFYVSNVDQGQRSLVSVAGPNTSAPVVTERLIPPSAFDLWGESLDRVHVATGTGVSTWDVAQDTFEEQIPFVAPARAIDGIGETALAVGDGGQAAILVAGSWADIGDPITAGTDFDGVFAAPAGFVAVGSAGGIFVRRGGAWTAVDVSSNSELVAVDGVSLEDFWAVSTDGTILHCTGAVGATTCAEDGPMISARYTDIAVAARNDITVVGGADVYHFDGLRWSPVRLGINRSAAAVATDGASLWFADPTLAAPNLEGMVRSLPWGVDVAASDN